MQAFTKALAGGQGWGVKMIAYSTSRLKNNRKWWWHTWSSWREESPYSISRLPKKPGCYAILLDGVVVYVGQSIDLRSRFYTHQIKQLEPGVWCTKWGILRGQLVIEVKYAQRYGDWAMTEQRLIDRLWPICNMRRS